MTRLFAKIRHTRHGDLQVVSMSVRDATGALVRAESWTQDEIDRATNAAEAMMGRPIIESGIGGPRHTWRYFAG